MTESTSTTTTTSTSTTSTSTTTTLPPQPPTFVTLFPDGNGYYQEFPVQYPDSGDHWDKVDEETPNDGDDYIATANENLVEKRDSFTIQGCDIPFDLLVNSVTVYNRVRTLETDGDAFAETRTLLRKVSTGDDAFGSWNTLMPHDIWETDSTTYTTSPFTGVGWTFEEVADLEAGVCGKSKYDGIEWSYAQCSAVWIVIEFTSSMAVTLFPNGNGSVIEYDNQNPDFGDHYDKVDDVYDADYIFTSSASWQRDCFTLPINQVEATSIIQVEVFVRHKESGLGENIGVTEIMVKTNGNEYFTALEEQVDWTINSVVYTTNPFTNISWTLEEINNLEVGTRGSGGLLGLGVASTSAIYVIIRFMPTDDLKHGSHTFDTSKRFTGSTNPLITSYTCGSGATLLVLGIVVGGGTNRTGGAPTYNGISMTQVQTTQKYATSPETSCEMWYLSNPITNSVKTISVPNSGARTLYIIASSYKAAVGKTSVLENSYATTGLSANPSVNFTTFTAGDVVVDVLGDGLNTVPTSNSNIKLFSVDDGSYSDNGQYSLQALAGNVVFSWNVGSDDWCYIIGAWKEQSPATTTTTTTTSTSTSTTTSTSTSTTTTPPATTASHQRHQHRRLPQHRPHLVLLQRVRLLRVPRGHNGPLRGEV